MQNDPEKLVGNFNEFYGERPSTSFDRGVFNLLHSVEHEAGEHQEVIQRGRQLVNDKIDSLLGPNNKLTRGDLVFPDVRFIETSVELPNASGYFKTGSNEIGIITGKIPEGFWGRVKVFGHEYGHFLSHNGLDEGEELDADTSISRKNNIGFQRYFGLDIRAGREGEVTSDYFLAWNEAVNEQFVIDVLPGIHETYGDYRGLLNQVIDDAVARKLGTPRANGVFQPWSQNQVKDYIYRCFFKGDLEGFTGLLKNIYKKYD